MPRPVQAENEAINADSFLDIVASVVSIMIVMVLVVGLRIKNTPVELSLEGPAQGGDELNADLAAERSLARGRAENGGRDRAASGGGRRSRGRQRDALALTVSLMERKAEASGPAAETPQDRETAGRPSAARGLSWTSEPAADRHGEAPADSGPGGEFPHAAEPTVDGGTAISDFAAAGWR